MKNVIILGLALLLAACGASDKPSGEVETQIELQAGMKEPVAAVVKDTDGYPVIMEADCPVSNPEVNSVDDMTKPVKCDVDATLEADCALPNPQINSVDDMTKKVSCDAKSNLIIEADCANDGMGINSVDDLLKQVKCIEKDNPDRSGVSRYDTSEISPALADRFSRLALDCVQREYPNKIAHVMNGDGDVKPPRELHPAFYGCFDMHSSVHGHWLLVRLLNVGDQDAAWRDEAIEKLQTNLTAENLAGETEYILTEGRASYERPYGLAWVLQLGAELRQWDDPRAAPMLAAMKPLEDAAVSKTRAWLPNLAYPIRLGTHNQSAFGFALMYDYALVAGNEDFAAELKAKSLEFHKDDKNCPISYEPSGEDFLSPCLQTADLMRRFMSADDYAAWLTDYMPTIPTNGSGNWLAPGVVKDASDGKLVHLDGVNLSRAWNLDGIAASLPDGDVRIASLEASRELHLTTGIAAVSDQHYSGSHWLASFAVYAVTRRGIE